MSVDVNTFAPLPTPGDLAFFGASSFTPDASTGDTGAVFNLSDADPNLRPVSLVFPNGIYDATVATVELKLSKAGKRQLLWTFKAFDNTNRTVTVRSYSPLEGDDEQKFKENMARLVREIKAVAPTLALNYNIHSDADVSRLCVDLATRSCRLKLKIGAPYNGRPGKNEVDWDGILPASQGFSFNG